MITIKKGFTLIELLVVIAIIAILAAILFPVFAQAREKARQANCLSNVKQLGTAMTLYIDDYDETYPPRSETTTTTWTYAADCLRYFSDFSGYAGQYTTWRDMIYPYVKNVNMFICPTRKGVSGYAFNCVFHYQSNGSGGFAARTAPIALATIKNSSNLVLMSDCYYATVSGTICGSDELGAWKFNTTGVNQPCRHNGGANVGFADGHAHYYKSCGNTTPDTIGYWNDGLGFGIGNPFWDPEY